MELFARLYFWAISGRLPYDDEEEEEEEEEDGGGGEEEEEEQMRALAGLRAKRKVEPRQIYSVGALGEGADDSRAKKARSSASSSSSDATSGGCHGGCIGSSGGGRRANPGPF